eukprot:11169771-Alexandrium_andersonii.AAC.1
MANPARPTSPLRGEGHKNVPTSAHRTRATSRAPTGATLGVVGPANRNTAGRSSGRRRRQPRAIQTLR